MTDKVSATFTLHTNDAIPVNNLNGLQWSCVNLKQILGDLYYKYNRFNLVLDSYAMYYGTGTNIGYYSLQILQFDFVSTLVPQYLKPNKLFPMTISPQLQLTSGVVNQFQANNGWIFNKPSNSVSNLQIYLVDRGGSVLQYTPGNALFLFTIYGIDDDE